MYVSLSLSAPFKSIPKYWGVGWDANQLCSLARGRGGTAWETAKGVAGDAMQMGLAVPHSQARQALLVTGQTAAGSEHCPALVTKLETKAPE